MAQFCSFYMSHGSIPSYSRRFTARLRGHCADMCQLKPACVMLYPRISLMGLPSISMAILSHAWV